jgi:hypothetical protein
MPKPTFSDGTSVDQYYVSVAYGVCLIVPCIPQDGQYHLQLWQRQYYLSYKC